MSLNYTDSYVSRHPPPPPHKSLPVTRIINTHNLSTETRSFGPSTVKHVYGVTKPADLSPYPTRTITRPKLPYNPSKITRSCELGANPKLASGNESLHPGLYSDHPDAYGKLLSGPRMIYPFTDVVIREQRVYGKAIPRLALGCE